MYSFVLSLIWHHLRIQSTKWMPTCPVPYTVLIYSICSILLIWKIVFYHSYFSLLRHFKLLKDWTKNSIYNFPLHLRKGRILILVILEVCKWMWLTKARQSNDILNKLGFHLQLVVQQTPSEFYLKINKYKLWWNITDLCMH